MGPLRLTSRPHGRHPDSGDREVGLVRALLSVASREGIGPFARDLIALGVEVFATEGTREALAYEGVSVRSVAELTGSEAIAGGQVKTCLLYTSDAADEEDSVGLGGRRIIIKKK